MNRAKQMELLRQDLGVTPEESMNVVFVLKCFRNERASLCNYAAAYLAHIADIAEEEGVH